MSLDFPYQIVTFLDTEPEHNEPVYAGEHGWYPQLALKRRFTLNGIDERQLIELLEEFFSHTPSLNIETGELLKPERMPVRVIDITNQDELMALHRTLLAALGQTIISRYPERDGDNYYAHITAEHKDEVVIPTSEYTHRHFSLANVWLLKDVDTANSVAYKKIR